MNDFFAALERQVDHYNDLWDERDLREIKNLTSKFKNNFNLTFKLILKLF